MKAGDIFENDYNPEALQRIQPPGCDFRMFVTPRFVHHYEGSRFEPLTARIIRSVAARKEVMLDVGAHYGFFSLLAASANPDLRIHALEPVAANHEILLRNLQLNGVANVTSHRLAASESSGRRHLLLSKASDNASFHPHPAAPALEEVEVDTMPLAPLLRGHEGSPLLVKIDTEGHEIPVLQGLAAAIGDHPDATLIVELNPDMQESAGHAPGELLQLLAEMGMATYLIQEEPARLIRIAPDSGWQDLLAVDGFANLYCRPRERAISICFLAHSHGLAGAERSMLELVTRLVADHGTVCNVVIPGEGPLKSAVEAVGAGVIAAEYGWWCSDEETAPDQAHQHLGDDLVRLLVDTLPQIERTQADLISTSSMVIPYGAVLAALLHKPHVWNLREYGSEGHHFYLPATERLRFIGDFSDFVFTASQGLGRTLLPHLDSRRIDHLYPAIEAPVPPESPFGSTTDTRVARTWRLVDLGSVIEAKQQEVDVRAVAEIIERGFQVSLLLKGPQDPEYVRKLQRIASSLGVANRIRFEGFSADVWSVYAGADVVLVSAPSHCFGRVAAEGMLAGRPVIYPRQTDIAEYMEDGVTGLAYDAGDFRGMADQLERLMREGGLAERIGRNARARAARLFVREGFGDKFIDKARQLVAAGPGERPPLPSFMTDSLLLGIQRLQQHGDNLATQCRSQAEELESVRLALSEKQEELRSIEQNIIAPKQQELDSVKQTLTLKQEELDSIKPVLAAREVELANVKVALDSSRSQLQRLLSTRIGRLAARIAKID